MFTEKDNQENKEQNDSRNTSADMEAQRIFEDGMPDNANAAAEPASLDEMLKDQQATENQSADYPDSQKDEADDEETAQDEPAESSAESANDEENFAGDESAESEQFETEGQYDAIVSGARKVSAEAHSHIKGWGIDADPANDPTYPIKKRTNEEQLGNTWKRPTKQKQTVEVLVSNERNNMPAIFSSKNPPKGISGALKRKAFQYSESDYRHWFGLVLSDKIGVLEGKIDDLKHGHIPNPVAERGLKSEWKYNRKEFIKKTAIKAAVTGAAIGLILLSRNRKTAR